MSGSTKNDTLAAALAEHAAKPAADAAVPAPGELDLEELGDVAGGMMRDSDGCTAMACGAF